MNGEINIQNLYDEILKNRNEFRNINEASKTRLEEANRKIMLLENENLTKQNSIFDQRTPAKQYSLEKNINEKCTCKKVNTLLGINLRDSAIANLSIKKSENGL